MGWGFAPEHTLMGIELLCLQGECSDTIRRTVYRAARPAWPAAWPGPKKQALPCPALPCPAACAEEVWTRRPTIDFDQRRPIINVNQQPTRRGGFLMG